MKKILIIEDDTNLQRIYQKKLTDEGFEVIPAFAGQEGLNLVQTLKPNLIILDIMLPGGINGFDVMEQIKRDPQYSAIPIIIMTNLESEEKVARTIGANDYLVKADTSLEKVVEVVKKYIA